MRSIATARHGGWGAAWGVLLTVACADVSNGPLLPPGQLKALPDAVVEPGRSAAVDVMTKGSSSVTVSYGQLPGGLSLGADGWVRGTPSVPGELQHFSLDEVDDLGRPVGSRSYTMATGVSGTGLSPPPSPTRTLDTVSFDGLTWSSPLRAAYAWDAQLAMLWPLNTGTGLQGAALAPMGSTLSLFVVTADGSSRFDLSLASADSRTAVVVQLGWLADADIDLQLLPAPTLNALTVNGANAAMIVNGAWVARLEISESVQPGPEVVTFANDLPAGQYALVATRAAGPAVSIPLWLTIHERNGTELIQERFDALMSDVAQGTVSQEIAAGRQSYMPLGVVAVSTGGVFSYLPPAGTDDPFDVTNSK